MKRLMIVLALTLGLLLSSSCFAGWNGEAWIGTIGNDRWPANPSFTSAARYTAGLDLGYSFNIGPITLNPSAKINVFMDERVSENFHPAGAQFYNGIELSYRSFFIEYEHMCWHPVDVRGKVYYYDMVRVGLRFGR